VLRVFVVDAVGWARERRGVVFDVFVKDRLHPCANHGGHLVPAPESAVFEQFVRPILRSRIPRQVEEYPNVSVDGVLSVQAVRLDILEYAREVFVRLEPRVGARPLLYVQVSRVFRRRLECSACPCILYANSHRLF